MEAILKVILTPHDPPDGLIGNYFLLIGDKNFNNFQKILELKVDNVFILLRQFKTKIRCINLFI